MIGCILINYTYKKTPIIKLKIGPRPFGYQLIGLRTTRAAVVCSGIFSGRKRTENGKREFCFGQWPDDGVQRSRNTYNDDVKKYCVTTNFNGKRVKMKCCRERREPRDRSRSERDTCETATDGRLLLLLPRRTRSGRGDTRDRGGGGGGGPLPARVSRFGTSAAVQWQRWPNPHLSYAALGYCYDYYYCYWNRPPQHDYRVRNINIGVGIHINCVPNNIIVDRTVIYCDVVIKSRKVIFIRQFTLYVMIHKTHQVPVTRWFRSRYIEYLRNFREIHFFESFVKHVFI